MKHYQEKGGSGEEPRNDRQVEIRRSSGEVLHEDQRTYRHNRAEDRKVDEMLDQLERLKDQPLTIRRIAALLGLFLIVNQGINWWRDKNVDPKQFAELKATVGELAQNVDSLARQFRNDRTGNNFIFYSICVQMQDVRPAKYPRFCERPEIQQFNPQSR